jgi:hypothetical protein
MRCWSGRGWWLSDPAMVEAQGLSVTDVRTCTISAGSALTDIVGPVPALSLFNVCVNMMDGHGWICVAHPVFARIFGRVSVKDEHHESLDAGCAGWRHTAVAADATE